MKNILVIGGSSGIGKHLISEIIGDNVLNISRRKSDLAHTIATDLSIDSNIISTIKEAKDYFADEKIDELYYCAGINESMSTTLLSDFSKIDSIIAVNSAAIIKILSLLQGSIRQGAGILILSSAYSQRSIKSNPVYSASKGFVDAFVRSYSRMLISDCPNNPIRINCINPEMAITEMTEKIMMDADVNSVKKSRILQRFLDLSEITSVMRFLNSETASGITGSSHKIGGEI